MPLTFEPVDEKLQCNLQKSTEQRLPEVLFIMLYKVALAFESVNLVLKVTFDESY